MSERTYTRQDVDDIVAPWLKLCKEHSDELAAIKEKASAAVNAPYEDILDMGLAQALRELEEVLPPP